MVRGIRKIGIHLKLLKIKTPLTSGVSGHVFIYIKIIPPLQDIGLPSYNFPGSGIWLLQSE